MPGNSIPTACVMLMDGDKEVGRQIINVSDYPVYKAKGYVPATKEDATKFGVNPDAPPSDPVTPPNDPVVALTTEMLDDMTDDEVLAIAEAMDIDGDDLRETLVGIEVPEDLIPSE